MGIWKKHKKKLILLIIILSIAAFYYPLRSYIIMSVYSKQHKKQSIFEKYDINVNIKGGISTLKNDYYPFLMYFNDSKGFSRFSNIECEMSIIYNFGSFNFPYISSTIFNEKSPYFGTFYGAYAVKIKDDSHIFGYDDDKINLEEIVLVPKYDLTKLVLSDIGCVDVSFKYDIDNVVLNKNGFDTVDAILFSNSLAHKYEGFKRNYFQYGRPFLWVQPKQSFTEIKYYGRIYSKYIKTKKITMFYYIISPSMETLEQCEKKFMNEIWDK